MDDMTEREELIAAIAQAMAEHGQSTGLVDWVADKIADTWDSAHREGWYDGLYTDPENGRPNENPYREEQDGI